MKKQKKSRYSYNSDTLLYEKQEESRFVRGLKRTAYVMAVAGTVCLYFWLYTEVFNFDLPKTARLRRENAEWQTKLNLLRSDVNSCEQILAGIETRDDDVYRAIYGLAPIPEDVKKAGYGGVSRYEYLDDMGSSDLLKNMVMRIDVATKRAYLQTNALDEVAVVARNAGDMKSCIPAVPPIRPKKYEFRISSHYGYRKDPVYHKSAFHDGVDFATTLGNPVYVTGDGTVVTVRYKFFGYGNEVMIDHGFGYKTRYAHMNSIDVVEGQKVSRGDRLGEVGNTGKSTGPHLHYEILYMKKPVNPSEYMDLSMNIEDYDAMTEKNKKLF